MARDIQPTLFHDPDLGDVLLVKGKNGQWYQVIPGDGSYRDQLECMESSSPQNLKWKNLKDCFGTAKEH